mmetsp:Transcript_21945/g.30846  ORF Transcript_21945/g.30846 Transcript_21945/m.30846 type:complete len:311 (+) Transcript_21945:117-1049(+)|eukprot:CAMPEP_0184857730 /NCGR_PEP_ID=MMETSP0580-20130426/2884_1 /TAXON_ID=1118495 /ORGANISM="Dactyliosolen fragilissimus" /LENGTH=310 /DNA_ID=CAMNT_0027353493 /DNA_START=84 /DNA_END=1016 /DNA_ORIENTATION=+
MCSSTDEDLDAFFDEVNEVEDEIKKKESDKIGTHSHKGEAFVLNNGETLKDCTIHDSSVHSENPSKRIRLDMQKNSGVVTGKKVIASSAPKILSHQPQSAVATLKALASSATSSSKTIFMNPIQSNKKVVMGSHYIPVSDVNSILNDNQHHGKHASAVSIGLNDPFLGTQTALPSSKGPINSASNKKAIKRLAAGKMWEDETLTAFPENDFRLFVGNLAKDITDAKLAESFSSKYPSFAMARICYDKANGTSRGFGFVSLMDYKDCARAIREMDQSWLGSRPIKVKRSEWKDRNLKKIGNKNKRGKGKRW